MVPSEIAPTPEEMLLPEDERARAIWNRVRKNRDAFYHTVKTTEHEPSIAQQTMRDYLEAEDAAQLKSLISTAVEAAHGDPKWWALVMAYGYGKPTEAMRLEMKQTVKRIIIEDGKGIDSVIDARKSDG